MGSSSSTTKKFYSNSEIQLENNIRDFELDIGFFTYDFNFIFSQIFIENGINNRNFDFKNINFYSGESLNLINKLEIKQANLIIEKFYSPKITNFLEKAYFKTKDYKFYDIKKIQIFLFLISNPSQVKDNDSYYSYVNKVRKAIIYSQF